MKKHPLRFSVKISQTNLWLMKALQREAVRQNRTVNNLIETILIKHFATKNVTNEQANLSDTSDRIESSK